MTQQDVLASYAIPSAVSDGLWLQPANADVKFLVLIPTQFNKKYTRSASRHITAGVRMTKTGPDFDSVDLSGIQEAQLDAFVATCILKCDNEAVALSTLKEKYPALVQELFDLAKDEAEKLDGETKLAAEKPLPT